MNFSSWINKTIFGALAVAALLVSFYAGHVTAVSGAQNQSNGYIQTVTNASGTPEQVDMTLFWKAWDLVNEKYAQTHGGTPATTQDRVYGAIQGMVASLGDPYTVFFTPSETTEFNTQIDGDFEGVGMELGVKDGILTVISALSGTPAKAAGIQTGDKILKINDTDAASMSIDQAVTLVRGKKGTTVTFTILRGENKTPIVVKVVRDTINLPTIDTSFDQKNNVFVIKLYSFSSQSADLFRLALRKFIESGTNKLVIDLRGNPGGYLDAAVSMASWFLPTGDVVVTENYGPDKGQSTERSVGYNVFNGNLKLVILVDGGSASASEILAGALSEHGKATLVGEKTFGKGSVQEYSPLDAKTAIKITVARWFTPNGKSISEQGLTPDVVVPMTADDVKNGLDPQMDKAIEILNK